MIIATFNVNSIRARLPILTRWLKDAQPDVLCLQETKVQDNQFPVDDIRSVGYEPVFRGEKSYNGVAILSKTPFDEVFYGFDGKGADEGSRIITAWVRGVPVVNTYIPQGSDPASDKFQYKLRWFGRLKEHFARHFDPENPLVWLGDFNVAPEPIDVHDPVRLLGSVGYHPDEHAALADVKNWGFIDLFRKHCPDPGNYSFWDYRARDAVIRKLGWRVDHIWATGTLADRSTRSWIDVQPRLWDRPSDHTPVCAKFSD